MTILSRHLIPGQLCQENTWPNGDDVRDAIETRALMNFDKVKLSMGNAYQKVDAQEDDRKAEQQAKLGKGIWEVEMMPEAKIKSFVDRKSWYTTNMGKVYAFFSVQCNKALQTK